MKFESKFGLGEVCIYGQCRERDGKRVQDMLVEVVAIQFNPGEPANYMCEHSSSMMGIQRIWIQEAKLEGDGTFDQDTGCYPPEILAES